MIKRREAGERETEGDSQDNSTRVTDFISETSFIHLSLRCFSSATVSLQDLSTVGTTEIYSILQLAGAFGHQLSGMECARDALLKLE